MFWLHLTLGLAVATAVLPMAFTGAVLAFQREVTAWFDNDVGVASADLPRLPASELVARATKELGAGIRTNSLQLERSTTAPAVLGADVRFWLLNPYDGHVLRPSAIRVFFLVAEEVHWSLGLIFLGMHRIGTALAGLVTVGVLLLSLTGPWLWWPAKPTTAQLRKRLWFSGNSKSMTPSLSWHHVIGIWCMPVILVTSLTGILLHYQGVRGAVGALLGSTPDAQVTLDADSAVREAISRAPEWSAIRLWWSDEGEMTVRVRLADGARPTQWAELASGPLEASGLRTVSLRRYQDGHAGDKLLGWARWMHTGQALGQFGQAAWGLAVLGIPVLVWTGLAMAFSRVRRRAAKGFARVGAAGDS